MIVIDNELPANTAPTANIPPANDIVPPLNAELLSALGDAPPETPTYGQKIHPDLAQRWLPILRKGLEKEVKENLVKEFTIPDNCKLLRAPSLNPEVSAAITETARQRDKKLEISQQQLGLGISAMNRAMTILLTGDDKIQAIKTLSEATRLLSDLHYSETQTRIKLITPGLDKNFLSVVKDSERDETLFGSDLPEKIKASKAIEKQGSRIKKVDQKPSATPSSSRSNPRDTRQGNWRGSSRSTNRGGRGGLKRGTTGNRRGQGHQGYSQSKWNINRFQRAN